MKEKNFRELLYWTVELQSQKYHSCEGKECVHVNIYLEEASQDEKELPSKKLDSTKPKSSNPLDPSDKKGKLSNVFWNKIHFPPSKSEKEEIDNINRVKSLFKNGYAIYKIESGETCECGYGYCSEVNIADCESTQMIIHHSKATRDSKNSSLVVLYRTTKQCDHKLFFTGSEDKLIRIFILLRMTTYLQNL